MREAEIQLHGCSRARAITKRGNGSMSVSCRIYSSRHIFRMECSSCLHNLRPRHPGRQRHRLHRCHRRCLPAHLRRHLYHLRPRRCCTHLLYRLRHLCHHVHRHRPCHRPTQHLRHPSVLWRSWMAQMRIYRQQSSPVVVISQATPQRVTTSSLLLCAPYARLLPPYAWRSDGIISPRTDGRGE